MYNSVSNDYFKAVSIKCKSLIKQLLQLALALLVWLTSVCFVFINSNSPMCPWSASSSFTVMFYSKQCVYVFSACTNTNCLHVRHLGNICKL